ncbi:MAG TPA: nucleotide exchange factor GrpE [Vicinamibacterales bacterium]|nr:nucleotide exchange factor GrpE [Vicinamibacterales bacterium]
MDDRHREEQRFGPPTQSQAGPVDVKVVDRRWSARGDAGGGAAGPPNKPTYVEELERRLAEKTEQLQAIQAQHRQAVQEFDEIRARMRRDVARDVALGRRQMLVELLDVMDNLDRALTAARDTGGSDPLRQGVEMVRNQFLARLEEFGVRRLQTMGEPFDPARHEAVSTIATDRPDQDGRVAGVIREGYTFGDELLRPAAVVVARLASEPMPS